MAGAGARAASLLQLLRRAAPFCTHVGAEVPATAAPGAAQTPQARPPYGSRKRPPRGDEEVAARAFSSHAPAPGADNKSFLWSRYGEMKRLVQGEPRVGG